MSNKVFFWTGILGVTFFGVASFLGVFQFDNYNPISQYISETMAIDTAYGKVLIFFGYIPSGILFCPGGIFTADTLNFKSTRRKTPTQKNPPINIHPYSAFASDTDGHFNPIHYLYL